MEGRRGAEYSDSGTHRVEDGLDSETKGFGDAFVPTRVFFFDLFCSDNILVKFEAAGERLLREGLVFTNPCDCFLFEHPLAFAAVFKLKGGDAGAIFGGADLGLLRDLCGTVVVTGGRIGCGGGGSL